MGEAETDGDGGRCFQRDHHAGHAAREYIDSDRQVRAPDGMPVALIDDDQIDDCVVDLHLLQRYSDFGRDAAGALQVTGGILAAPAARDFSRVQASDASPSPAVRA